MSVRVAGVFTIKVTRLYHPGDAIEVMHVVMVELAIGVVPKLIVRVDHRLVVMKYLHRHA